jgi:dihydrofolate reductase
VKKLILYSAVSLDNRIARENGDISWMDDRRFKIPGEDFGYARFYSGIDTTLMGHNTYRLALSLGRGSQYKGKTNYVFTRSRTRRTNPFVTFAGSDIPSLVRTLKRQRGKNIWLVGGSQINTLLLDHRLIDRMILTFVPVFLGEGIPLFGESVKPASFILKSRKTFANGFVQITWDRKWA